MNTLDILEVMNHLPHRYPLLLVDKVVSLEVGKSIEAIKNVTINEPFFTGHFPHYPVMPGVLVVEALAQAAGILSVKTMGLTVNEKSLFFFAGIDSARFKKPVVPGDQLRLQVEIIRHVRNICKYKGKALVGDTVVAEAEIMCAYSTAA